MVQSIGNATAYVAGTGGRPLPTADTVRPAGGHAPTKPKATGLNWDAITPTCNSCGQRSGQLGDGGLCPTCRGTTTTPAKPSNTKGDTSYAALPEDELLRRFTGPDDTQLGRDLAQLESDDPAVAAAADALGDSVARMVYPAAYVDPDQLDVEEPTHEEEPAGHPARDHLEDEVRNVQDATQLPETPVEETPAHDEGVVAATGPQEATPTPSDSERVEPIHPESPSEYSADANLDAQVAHATRVLRDTAAATDPVTRLLRLNVLSAVESLWMFTQLHPQTPAPATSTSAGAGKTSPEPLSTSQGLGGGRPAADAEGEAARQPATPQKATRPRRAPRESAVDADRIVELYTAGKYMREVQDETGHAVSTIKRVLKERGVEIRPRGPRPGDRSKAYDQALIDNVRTLYVIDELTQAQVADKLGIGLKVVQNVMTYAGIPARDPANVRSQAGIGHPIKIQPAEHQAIVDRYRAGEPASRIGTDYGVTSASIYHVLEQHGVDRGLNRVAPGVDTLGRLRDAIDATGATSREIKDWALNEGLISGINRGLPHLGLVEAYATAHPNPTGDTPA